MTKSLKCIGWVLVGVAGSGVVGALLLAAIFGLMWAGIATALALGYTNSDGLLFMVGYVFLCGGFAVGVGLCVEHRR